MNLFRNLLFWIVLVLVGALLAQLLLQDPGYVLVRYRGTDYTTTLAAAVLIGAAVLLALWLLWKLLTAPVAALRRRRVNADRARLLDGLEALELGQWERAESLLGDAARTPAPDGGGATRLARVGAARAAASRGQPVAASAYLDPLAQEHPATRAVLVAELALAHGQPAQALEALDAPAVQPLPPRGLALRAQALAAMDRAGDAYGLLGAMRSQQVLPESRLEQMEAQWATAALREAADANMLAERWDGMPRHARTNPATVAAYARRAAALRWEDAATGSIEHALDAGWDESLAALYGELPVGRLDARRQQAERWLQDHPESPGLLLTLARLSRARGQWIDAGAYLHRALAHGAGAEAWEELGHGYAQAGDEVSARLCYANALRASRGEPVQERPQRDLRQVIGDHAVVEERDDHGMPRLRE